MPAYEFRCRECGDTFIVNRPMEQSSAPALCPAGHDDTIRLLGVAAVATGSGAAAPQGGGCCGGGCCSA